MILFVFCRYPLARQRACAVVVIDVVKREYCIPYVHVLCMHEKAAKQMPPSGQNNVI